MLNGITVQHSAVAGNQLHELPIEFVTEERLLATSSDGKTSVHVAAEHRGLEQIPSNLLTPKILLSHDNAGETPLHLAVLSGQVELLLGIDFGENEEARQIVGEKWWNKNKLLLAEQAKVIDVPAEVDIELF